MAEGNIVEETLKRLTAHKGVEGVLILTGEGVVIRSTLESSLSSQYASWVSYLVAKARSTVEKLDRTTPQDDLSTIRIRSKQQEIIIAPEALGGHEYILVAIHNADAS